MFSNKVFYILTILIITLLSNCSIEHSLHQYKDYKFYHGRNSGIDYYSIKKQKKLFIVYQCVNNISTILLSVSNNNSLKVKSYIGLTDTLNNHYTLLDGKTFDRNKFEGKIELSEEIKYLLSVLSDLIISDSQCKREEIKKVICFAAFN